MKPSKLFGSWERGESRDLVADNVCTKSLHWVVPFSFCEQVGEEGLYSQLGLGAKGLGHPTERGSGNPICPVPWSKKPMGWLSGWSHSLLPV